MRFPFKLQVPLSGAILAFICCLQLSCYGKEGKKKLFQVIEHNRIGYMDQTGKVVIKPVFRSAGNFSEELAYVRINGKYGYIDETGRFAIPPKYDLAGNFKEGFAIVYIDSIPQLINNKGMRAFSFQYAAYSAFNKGRALVQTASGKMGVINRQGQLVIDTAFTYISPFANGLAVVSSKDTSFDKKGAKYFKTGIIDTLGHFVVPYGKYAFIDAPVNGYFRAGIEPERWDSTEGYTAKAVFLDETGRPVLEHLDSGRMGSEVHCGLIQTSLHTPRRPGEDEDEYLNHGSYKGYVNLKGELVINDTNIYYSYDFRENRAFVADENWKYRIINTSGKYVSDKVFNRIQQTGFVNGLAMVEINDKWGLVDTNGNFVIKPQFGDVDEFGSAGDYLFFRDIYGALTGLAKKDGQVILNPMMQDYDRAGFDEGLLKCIIRDKLSYIDQEGNIVWQENKDGGKQMDVLNIDFCNRGYFYATANHNNEYTGHGAEGYAAVAHTIPPVVKFPANKLSVTVRKDITDTIFGMYRGITVHISNTTAHDVVFNAQDGRLYMKVQALNAKGEWQDIEYLPSSWCGNSYHTITLEPNQYWALLTPDYEGDFKTKLRIWLKYVDPADTSEQNTRKKNELIIYSNEYDASINPAQFWNKKDYHPQGLMDPYND